jgi:hypothetical protein
MLLELAELGKKLEAQGLLAPFGYGFISIAWELMLNEDSVDIIPVATDSKLKTKKMCIPDIARNNTNPIAPCDSAEYVLGLGDRGESRHQKYLNLLKELYGDLELGRKLHQVLTEKKYTVPTKMNSGDRLVISFDGVFLHELPEFKSRWILYVNSQQETITGTCSLSGKECQAFEKTIPKKIKGVRGSLSSGAALISFDKDFSQSYGWKNNENALIDKDIILLAYRSLEWILNEKTTHWHCGNDDLTFIFWGDASEGIHDDIWNSDITKIDGAFTSLDGNGYRRKYPLSNSFVFCTLKGNSGRISLEDVGKISAENIRSNIERFFQDQLINESWKPYPIWRLVSTMYKNPKKEYTKDIKKSLAELMLFGTPLPRKVVTLLLARIYADRDIKSRANILALYAKTTLLQNKKMKSKQAEALGRIAFCLHQAQSIQRGSSNTNIIKCLKALAHYPCKHFHRLLISFQRDYFLVTLSTRIGELSRGLEIPETLTKEEQTVFMLGFIQEQDEYWSAKNKEVTQ